MSWWCLVLCLKKECKIIRNVAGRQFEDRQLVLFSHVFASFSSTCGGCWVDLSTQTAQPVELPQATSVGPSVVENISVPRFTILNARVPAPPSQEQADGGTRAALDPASSTSPAMNHGQTRIWTCWWVWLDGGAWAGAGAMPYCGLAETGATVSHFSSFFFFLIVWILPGHCLLVKHPKRVNWKQIKLFFMVTEGFFSCFCLNWRNDAAF